QSTGRIAAEDIELGGQRIARGEQLLLGWAAANRDDSVFPHADRIDLNRDAGRHLAFGAGQHYCVGAAMVREMFTAMLEEVFDRIPDYTVADDAAIEWFPDLTPVYGIKALPIRFTPGR
ncbi:cytochrome P450, partial [Streptomyces sp. SID337]|uniref:cytochrome P450 n=2 Tax=Streptomyces TaxID=1883 RepID=UPI0013697BAC